MNRIGELSFSSPIFVGSGPSTAKARQIEDAERAGAGAVSLKLAFKKVPIKGQFRSFSVAGEAIVHSIDRRLTAEEEAALIRQAKKRTSIPLFANFSAMHDRHDEWKELAAMFEDAGADALELNFCCPNLDVSELSSTERTAHEGSFICRYPAISGEVTRAVKESANIPVICKMIPGDNCLATAKEIEKAGADAVHIVGEPNVGLPPVDATSGKPLTPFVSNIAVGASNGPICRYSTFACAARLASVIRAPIIASGGIETFEDVISSMMWGASFSAICSGVLWRGYELIEGLNKRIRSYVDENGLTDISEIVGRSLKYLVRADEMKITGGAVEIDADKCTGCGRCIKPAHCDALALVEEKARVDMDKCMLCGICRGLCPAGAISYIDKDSRKG